MIDNICKKIENITLNKTLYFILSFTWGLPLTLIGCVVALVLIIIGIKPKRFLYGFYFPTTNGSGFNMGPIAIVSKNSSEYLLKHEFGHSIQNCFFGPFVFFLVIIPSVIRFWYREYLVYTKQSTYKDLPPYDSAWFEGTATSLGEKYLQHAGNNK